MSEQACAEVLNLRELCFDLGLKNFWHKSSQSEVQKSYLKLSAKNHPDKHPNEHQKYTDIFSEINNAYHDLLKHYFNEQKNSKLEIN